MVKNRCSPISKALFVKLKNISTNLSNYYPCKVTLKNGQVLDCVYIVELQTYIKTWGRCPDENDGKKIVSIDDVMDIEESPARLPIHIANKLYKAGESGMGYTIATFIFKDGSKQSVINAHDFIEYPSGKNKDDIIDVLPHEGRKDPNLKDGPSFYYCIYCGVSTKLIK